MAGETEELGLQITGEDLTKGAFSSVQGNIDKTNEHVSEFSRSTIKETKSMSGGFQQFAHGLESGNVGMAMKGFFKLVLTGMKSIEAEEVIMTLGLSVLVAVIVKVFDHFRTAHEEAAKAAEEHKKKEQELQKTMEEEVKTRQEKEMTAAEKLKAIEFDLVKSKNALAVGATKQAIAKIEEEYQAHKIAIEKQKLDVQKMFDDKLIDGDQRIDAANNLSAELKNLERKMASDIAKVNSDLETSKTQYAKLGLEHARRIANERKQIELTESQAAVAMWKQTMVEIDAEVKRRQAVVKGFVSSLGHALAGSITFGKEKAELDKINESYQERHQEIMNSLADQTMSERERERYLKEDVKLTKETEKAKKEIREQYATAKELKEGFKNALKVALDFAEDYILTQEAAALSTSWWNPAVYFKLAATAVAFQVAKAAVDSFQTPDMGSRRIPGPPNAMKLIAAHGGEEIGRGGADAGMQLVVNGDYFESDQANEKLFNRLYRYQKRTGTKIQPV